MTLFRCAVCGESMTDLLAEPLAEIVAHTGVAWCYTCGTTRPVVPAADWPRSLAP